MTIRKFQSEHPSIEPSVYIDATAVVIGDVSIAEDSSIWPMVTVRGDVQKISIGKRTNIQDGSVLHVTADNQFNPGGYALTIGSDVTIGHNAILHACTVEDESLIGMGAIILDGAIIQRNAMVAAGSIVGPGKVIESGYLWIGSPAKKIRPLAAKEIDYLAFSSRHYVELKNKHMGLN